MRASWSNAPWWLKGLCVLGVPWCLAFVALGVPLLVQPGPGLPLIWLGLAGIAPWVFLARRGNPRE